MSNDTGGGMSNDTGDGIHIPAPAPAPTAAVRNRHSTPNTTYSAQRTKVESEIDQSKRADRMDGTRRSAASHGGPFGCAAMGQSHVVPF